jgi:hypothetical protein
MEAMLVLSSPEGEEIGVATIDSVANLEVIESSGELRWSLAIAPRAMAKVARAIARAAHVSRAEAEGTIRYALALALEQLERDLKFGRPTITEIPCYELRPILAAI